MYVIVETLRGAYKRQHLFCHPTSSWNRFISPFLVSRDFEPFRQVRS